MGLIRELRQARIEDQEEYVWNEGGVRKRFLELLLQEVKYGNKVPWKKAAVAKSMLHPDTPLGRRLVRLILSTLVFTCENSSVCDASRQQVAREVSHKRLTKALAVTRLCMEVCTLLLFFLFQYPFTHRL
jgi:hypothetical protein